MPKAKGDRERAEAQFDKKLQARQAGAKAMSDYEAAGVAMRAKTAKLRALRLAKEAADKEATDKEAAGKAPAAKTSKARKKPVEGTNAALSEWLAAQRAQGRRS